MERSDEIADPTTPPPTGGAPPQVHTCDICGAAMFEHNCKIVCPVCGYKRDCTDP